MSGFTLRRLWNIVRYWIKRPTPLRTVHLVGGTVSRVEEWSLGADGLWHGRVVEEHGLDMTINAKCATAIRANITYGDI